MVKLNNDMTFQQRIQQQALLGNMDMYVARAKLYIYTTASLNEVMTNFQNI